MNGPNDRPLVWLIAGEPSGDLIGARLISALNDTFPGGVRVAGIGGDAMAGAGLESRFPISDIAVMGLVEVVPRIPAIKRRIRETVDQIRTERPDIVVSIDAPGFCYRVWKGLRGSGIPLAHYVAPSVWAWNPGRAKKFAAELDHLLALLPFEPPYFEREGLDCTFAGHPVLEGGADKGDGAAFRKRHDIASDATVICILPGSRRGEVARLAPIFHDAADRMVSTGRLKNPVFVFPTVSYLAGFLRDQVRTWPGRTIVLDDIGEKFDAMAASDVALAASGTVSLELCMAGVPHLIAYRMNPVTIALFRLLRGLKQRYANLVNILLDREAIPELIQDRCRPDRIAETALRLMDDGEARSAQQLAARQALSMLRPDERTPSAAAADVVKSLIRKNISESSA